MARRHAPRQQRRHHQTCTAQQQPHETDCSLRSSCAAGSNSIPDLRHAHAAEPRQQSSSAPVPASGSFSRRQAMQRAAALAAAAAWLPGQRPLPAAAADSGALMVAPPSAQAPQGGARPSRGNPLRRVGLVQIPPADNDLEHSSGPPSLPAYLQDVRHHSRCLTTVGSFTRLDIGMQGRTQRGGVAGAADASAVCDAAAGGDRGSSLEPPVHSARF
jgi:hypothetical protein